MRFLLWALAIAIGECLGIYAADVLAQGNGVHLTCRLSAIAEEAEEGRYACIGESGTVTLDVSAWDYMIDYLRSMNGSEIVIGLGPK
jgi:hypothetical protein